MMSTPKRVLPPGVVGRLFLSGTANQMAWLTLGVGGILGWVMLLNVDFSVLQYRGNVEQTVATVIDSSESNVTINDRTLTITSYRFVAADGRPFEDYSFAYERLLQEGSQVRIEYPRGKPHLSRLEGMRRKPLGLYGALLGLGPLSGLLFLGLRVRKALRLKYLLQHGALTTGVLVDKVSTNMEVNNQMVYKLTFHFTANDGRDHQLVHKSHNTQQLEDEHEERLLYDPARPGHAVLVDTLPGAIDLDDRNQLHPQNMPVGACILPVLMLLGHGVYALSVLR